MGTFSGMPPGTVTNASALAGSAWQLVAEDDAQGHHLVSAHVPTLSFVGATVEWHACNDGTTSVRIGRGRLTALGGDATAVACITRGEAQRNAPVAPGDAERDLEAVLNPVTHAVAVWFIDTEGAFHLRKRFRSCRARVPPFAWRPAQATRSQCPLASCVPNRAEVVAPTRARAVVPRELRHG